MRITIKPPSPAPSPPLPEGALLTVRVETADPAPRIDGPVSIAYEGRYVADPAPGAFLFSAPKEQEVSTAAPAASDFRTPPAPVLLPRVDVDAAPGDTITATLLAGGKAYTAATTAPSAPLHPNTAPVVLQLAEGGAAPPPGPPPTPQPAPGLTITPDPGDPDVLNLDPAPGNDNIVVEN